MLPDNYYSEQVIIQKRQETYPTKTYDFDFRTGDFVTGKTIDGMEAIRQWVEKALQTPRYRYLIYSSNYGSELEEVIGQHLPKDLFEAEVKRKIEDCLRVHPLILSITEWDFKQQKDAGFLCFTVNTTEGSFIQEVNINV